jgi:CubicO group peptidase (beta-lactamase class C family)
MKKIILGVLFAALIAGCATAPRYPERPDFSRAPATEEGAALADYLSRWVPAFMEERHIPGLGIALADSGGLVWASGFGWADREKRVPFTADTRCNVGSVSKLFTNAALMKLVEEGRVDLDSPLADYLPEFSIKTHGWPASGITLRSMLTHHSGLPSDILKGFTTADARPEDYPDTFLKLPAALGEEYAAQPPGTVFSYSNIAYSLLGAVVARVSGRSFEEQVQAEVLGPLGMHASSFLMSEDDRTAAARGYPGGPAQKIPYIRDLPAGSLVSTAADMGLFMSGMIRAVDSGSGMLKRPTIMEMWRKQNDGVARDLEFGIGLTWWQVSLPGLPGVALVGHGGDLDGYHALLLIDPEHRVGAFIMVNGVDGIGSFTLGAVASQALGAMIQARGGRVPPPPSPAPAAAELPAGFASRVVGHYATPQGFSEVRLDRGKLKVFAFGHWLDATYHTDGTVTMEARVLFFKLPVPVLEEMSFTMESPDGEDYLAMRAQGLLLAPCQKIHPVTVPQNWLERGGAYRIENQDSYDWLTDVNLRLDRPSGFYLLEMSVAGAKQAFPLYEFTDSGARLMGYGRNLGQTIRFVPGEGGEKLLIFGHVLSRK